jgi:hypothetical protein
VASLATLDPDFRPAAEWFFGAAHDAWPDLVVTSARRSHVEQMQLYESYRRGNSRGVYHPAPPGRSAHEAGLAFDMARNAVDPRGDPVLAYLGGLWRSLGGVWGGKSDPVHFSCV